jgi:hypothetical protein
MLRPVGGELNCSLILRNSFSIVFESHDLGIRLQGFVKNQYVRK